MLRTGIPLYEELQLDSLRVTAIAAESSNSGRPPRRPGVENEAWEVGTIYALKTKQRNGILT